MLKESETPGWLWTFFSEKSFCKNLSIQTALSVHSGGPLEEDEVADKELRGYWNCPDENKAMDLG